MILTVPRKNQREAVRKALKYDGFAIYSQQRVGKSLTALMVVDARKPDILFIVCPKKAIKVWRKQIKEHLKIDWECLVIIVHYEMLSRSARDRRWYRQKFRHEWADKTTMIIVDEGHRIKRRGSMQSRMVRSIGELSTWRLLLSGTPLGQGREDVWAQFDFIEPGLLEFEYEDFEDEYLKLGGYKKREVVGYKNTAKFDEIFHSRSFRITLREAQIEAGRLPYRVLRRKVEFDLKPETREIYTELEKELRVVVRKRKVSTPLLMTLVQKLQQIAGGFLIHTEQVYDEETGEPKLTKKGHPVVIEEILPIGREKLRKLGQLLALDSVFRSERFVICARYTHELEHIGKLLTKLGYTWKLVSGEGTFDGKFDTDAVLLQIQIAEAIDLSLAPNYIFYSWNHSYINYEQSKFRVLAFDTKLVRYYYLIARDTVDVDIYHVVAEKMKLSRYVCDTYRRKAA